ncbi:acyl carrier protein [Corynebacterium sp. KPL1824]|nr:acyl carrier protein [Corynebacterium sp. KPL1824]
MLGAPELFSGQSTPNQYRVRLFLLCHAPIATTLGTMANDLSAQLQAKFQGSDPDKDHDPDRDTLGELIALIIKVTGTEAELGRDSALSDVGVESLELIELTVRVEELFKVRLTEETMLNCETIGDIADYLEDHQ